MSQKIELFFEEKIIGFALSPKIDGFDFYGAWNPLEGDGLSGFLEALTNNGEAWVKIGSENNVLYGTVEFIPEKEIEIKIRPDKK